tara:strand:- start:409 stop:1980 length:1572 start_codon:yes stop_codon:yes gene_type:complete
MSYLQFGGRNQNLKSSTLENLKVTDKLYVLDETTLRNCRFINNFTFTGDPTLSFDLDKMTRFYDFYNASNISDRIPLEYLDVVNLDIKGELSIESLNLDGILTYRNTSELTIQNLIGFPENGSYDNVPGVNNVLFGRYVLQDISGDANIAIGNAPTSYHYKESDNVGYSNYNNNIIMGNNIDFGNTQINNSIALGNNISIAASNTIYLGSSLQNKLETYSYLDVYNGIYLGKDISNTTFIFNNLDNRLVTQSSQSIVASGDNNININSSNLNYYGAKNYIMFRSEGNSYSWKILLQANDNDSTLLGIQKSLIFLSPSGRGYYLRDDPIGDTASNATGAINITSFTGQHSVILSSSFRYEVGKIVVSLGSFNNFSSGVKKNLPNMNEALPVVGYTNLSNDKRVFGVLSTAVKVSKGTGVYTYNEGPWSTEINSTIFKERCWANSIGEGSVLVTNLNGNLVNGDYITTSTYEGYGMKQDDDILHSYTVAKITEDMDFTDSSRIRDLVINGNNIKVCLVGCTYHCG